MSTIGWGHKTNSKTSVLSNVYRMPFGKHKGMALSEIPRSYLLWLREWPHLIAPLEGYVKAELTRRSAIDGVKDRECVNCGSLSMMRSSLKCRFCGHALKSIIVGEMT